MQRPLNLATGIVNMCNPNKYSWRCSLHETSTTTPLWPHSNPRQQNGCSCSEMQSSPAARSSKCN